jgi:hypothetical protein
MGYIEQRDSMITQLQSETEKMAYKLSEALLYQVVQRKRIRTILIRDRLYGLAMGIETRLTVIRHMRVFFRGTHPTHCSRCLWYDHDRTDGTTRCLLMPRGLHPYITSSCGIPDCCLLWGDIRRHPWWITPEGERFSKLKKRSESDAV